MVLKAPHMQNIGLFDAIFPDEKLFLILRDGRDVVASSLASFSKNPFMRKGFSALCHEWALASDAAIETAQRLKSQAMLVRYEDLARLDPSYTESLLRHAGLNPETYPWQRLKDLPLRGSSELAIQGEVNWKQQSKPANFNPVGRWNQWPDRLKQKFRAIAGKALIQAGYESASEW
jgi:protein-tyrosine sulfotransferase